MASDFVYGSKTGLGFGEDLLASKFGDGGQVGSSWITHVGTVVLGGDTQFQPPKKPVARADNQVVTTERSAYGTTIPAVRGAARLNGTLIFRTSISRTVTRSGTAHYVQSQSSDALGNVTLGQIVDVGNDVTTVRYRCSAVILIADTSLTATGRLHLLRVWANGGLVIDKRFSAVLQNQARYRYYRGDQTVADPLLIREKGAATAPAFIKCAYIVLEDFDVEAYGGKFPEFEFEIAEAITDDSAVTTLRYVPPLTAAFDTDSSFYCIDFDSSFFYVILQDNAHLNTFYVSTISLQSHTEVNRVKIKTTAYNVIYSPIAVPGGRYILCTTANLSNRNFNITVDVSTGAVIDIDGTDPLNEDIWNVVAHYAGGYLALGFHSTIGGSLGVGFSTLGALYIDSRGRLSRLAPSPRNSSYVVDSQAFISVAYANGAEVVAYAASSAGGYVLKIHVLNGAVTVRAQFVVSGLTGVVYDLSDDTLILSIVTGSGPTDAKIEKRSLDGATTSWTTTISGAYNSELTVMDGPGATFRSFFELDIEQKIVWSGANRYFILDTVDGSLEEVLDTFVNDISISASKLLYWRINGDQNFVEYKLGDRIPVPLTIREMLSRMARTAGYAANEIFADGVPVSLTATGYIIRDQIRYRDMMQAIASLYCSTIVDSDGGIKIRRPDRNDSFVVDAAIAEQGLIENATGGRVIKIASTRDQESSIPAEISVTYLDVDTDYQAATQVSRRPKGVFQVTSSTRRENISIPLSLTANQARTRTLDVLYSRIAAKVKLAFGLSPQYGYIEPGDIVNVTLNDLVYTCRIIQATYKADYSQEIQAELFMTDDDSSAEGAAPITVADLEAALSMTRYVHLDVPLLSFSHDQAGAGLVQYHTLTGRGQPNWQGGTLYRSTTDSAYVAVSQTLGIYPPVASAYNVLAAPAWDFQTDYVNTLVMRTIAGNFDDLASVSYDERMGGANTFAVGVEGRWEIIRAGTVTVNDDGTITLSELTRGVRGTEIFEGLHEEGDLIVWLTSAFYSRLIYEITALDTSFYFRPVGISQTVGQVPPETHTIPGAAETPYAPVELRGYFSSTDDIELAWTRRSRLDDSWVDDTESPAIGEAAESYVVEIMGDGSPDILLRTLTASTVSVIYTNAQIMTDFGYVPPTIKFRVYQISALVGRGYMAEAIVTVV